MKRLLSIVAVAALVLTGCNKDLKVTPAERLTIEHGDELDNNKFFDAKKSDKNIEVDKAQDFNVKKAGDQTLRVTFADGNKAIQKNVKITAEGTKEPETTLKKNKIMIIAGNKLTLKDNVKAVKGPVDDALKHNNKEIKKSGYYIDKGRLSTKKVGAHEVIAKAFNVNGNRTEEEFKVIIKEKEKAEAIMEGQKSEAAQNNNSAGRRSETSSLSTGDQNTRASGGQGSSTTNTGSSSDSNGTQNSTPSQTRPSAPASAPPGPYIVDNGRRNPKALPISIQSPIFGALLETEVQATPYFESDDENGPYFTLGWYSTGVCYGDGTEEYPIWWYQFT